MNFQRVFEKFHIDLKVIFSYNFSPIDQTTKETQHERRSWYPVLPMMMDTQVASFRNHEEECLLIPTNC